ncbi:MAG: hypothetical protein MI723_00105, partial [Caulobacterales bacterium]|nr:hypothetical protein [Caulobacterales bacterium]
ARFDAMEPHRAGLAPILSSARRDPLLAARLHRARLRTARWLLEIAGVDSSGGAGMARTHGFAVILARVTREWLRDEAGDLSRTMRALDRALRSVEGWRARWDDLAGKRARAEPEPEGPEPIRPAGDAAPGAPTSDTPNA